MLWYTVIDVEAAAIVSLAASSRSSRRWWTGDSKCVMPNKRTARARWESSVISDLIRKSFRSFGGDSDLRPHAQNPGLVDESRVFILSQFRFGCAAGKRSPRHPGITRSWGQAPHRNSSTSAVNLSRQESQDDVLGPASGNTGMTHEMNMSMRLFAGIASGRVLLGPKSDYSYKRGTPGLHIHLPVFPGSQEARHLAEMLPLAAVGSWG